MKDFLDEYKHLEKLCNDLYNQQHGISLYISDMEATPRAASIMISEWNKDLKVLKHLRHIRNAMVHDLNEQEVTYTQEDIRNLKEFHRRIMEQRDPLSLLVHKTDGSEPREKTRKTTEVTVSNTGNSKEVSAEHTDSGLSVKEGLIISLIVLIVVLLTVGVLVARDKGWI
ncbi:MAG: hypothetical protein K6E47_01220 [Lachnospiraceae bacterium]|nr:hypothetical protein [Lachnospiraceae bacterium]